MKYLPLFIGLRYTRAKRRNQFISIISIISVLGIMLGIMALIIVLSVMNGFHSEIKHRILGMTSHASIVSSYGMYDWQDAMKKAKQHPDVIGAAPFVEGQAMLTNQGIMQAALIRGILPEMENDVSSIHEKILPPAQLSDLVAGKYRIILGEELALLLNVHLGDKVTLLTPQITTTILGSMPRMRRFTVQGIFNVGMGEYDRGIAFIHMNDAKKLFKMPDTITGVRLKTTDLFKAPMIAKEIKAQSNELYQVNDWTTSHRNFFAALAMEKRMMSIILFLIVIVATFNIMTTLVMMVIDKQADIAILRTLGATSQTIRAIFIIQGTIIGFFGSIIGIIMGLLVAFNLEDIVSFIENTFHISFIDKNIYYISQLPSEVLLNDVLMISGGAFFITILATIYPAWKASKIQPAEALRYE